jgi:hypothetical protein
MTVPHIRPPLADVGILPLLTEQWCTLDFHQVWGLSTEHIGVNLGHGKQERTKTRSQEAEKNKGKAVHHLCEGHSLTSLFSDFYPKIQGLVLRPKDRFQRGLLDIGDRKSLIESSRPTRVFPRRRASPSRRRFGSLRVPIEGDFLHWSSASRGSRRLRPWRS